MAYDNVTAAIATVPTTLPSTTSCDERSTMGFSSGLSFFACATDTAHTYHCASQQSTHRYACYYDMTAQPKYKTAACHSESSGLSSLANAWAKCF